VYTSTFLPNSDAGYAVLFLTLLGAPVNMGEARGGLRLDSMTLDLRRVCEAPFLERPGRLPLGQGSKREEAWITVTAMCVLLCFINTDAGGI